MRMGRSVILAVVVPSLVAMAAALDAAGASDIDRVAGAKSTRTESRTYSAMPTGYTKYPGGPIVAEVSFPKDPERFVSFEIADESGAEVSASFLTGDQDFGSVFCTSTPSPLPVPAGGPVVRLELFVGTCPDGTPSLPTSGKVEATFYRNLPLPRREVTGYSPFYWRGGVRVPGGVITSIVDLSPGPGRFLSLKINDESGGKVGADIEQGDTSVAICGETSEPVRVKPNFATEITIYAGTCDDGSMTPSTPTRGTITATFSNTR